MPYSFNPFDPEQSRDSWDVIAAMRADTPLADIDLDMRYVTRWEECRALMRDTASFSNASGMKAPGVDVPFEDRILGELDPPRHTTVRRVIVTALTPKVVHAAEGFMRDAADELLALDPGDLVAGFSVPFPNRVTVHLLGLPVDDAPQIAVWAKGLMESEFPRTNRTERGEGFAAAFPEFAGYIDERLADPPPGGIIERIAGIEVEGELLSASTKRALVRNLITGGLTTTSQLIGNLLHEILTNPVVEREVRASDGALTIAIEESLRLRPPLMFVARACVRDAEVAGCPVQAGTRVLGGIASANRDERVFDEAEEFRTDRDNADQHLTFGFGAHVCPGAAVARVETRIAVRAFLDRYAQGSIRLADDFVYENVPTFFECGPQRLPVQRS